LGLLGPLAPWGPSDLRDLDILHFDPSRDKITFLKKTKNRKKDVRKQEKDVLKQEKDVLKQKKDVLEQ
jgi:hypothetical protein